MIDRYYNVIERFLLPETSLIRSHIENVVLKEIQKTFDARILAIIGNGKKRYSEIRDKIVNSETGLLDKQLKILMDMETIQKPQIDRLLRQAASNDRTIRQQDKYQKKQRKDI